VPPGLGEILAESGDLTLRRLRRASDWRRAHGGTIERALLATGGVSEETLLDALARLTGLPSVSRERLGAASREAVEALPADTRRRLRALPFDRRGDVLLVAVADPGNPVLETGLVASTGCSVRLYVTAEPILEDVLRAWAPAGGPAELPPDLPAPVPAGAGAVPPAPRRPLPADPIARLARALLADALEAGAEAVEIGPEGRGATVRTWAGGAVRSARPIPPALLGPLLAWLAAHNQSAGPFDEGGLVLERAGRRAGAQLTLGAGDTAWIVFASGAPAPEPSGSTEICLHEGADGDVFCPACGAPL